MTRLLVIPGERAEASGPGPSGRGPEHGLLAERYARHAGAVLGRCRWLLRDEEAARDAAQEVFARALRALPAYREAASPSSRLLAIATHHCVCPSGACATL